MIVKAACYLLAEGRKALFMAIDQTSYATGARQLSQVFNGEDVDG